MGNKEPDDVMEVDPPNQHVSEERKAYINALWEKMNADNESARKPIMRDVGMRKVASKYDSSVPEWAISLDLVEEWKQYKSKILNSIGEVQSVAEQNTKLRKPVVAPDIQIITDPNVLEKKVRINALWEKMNASNGKVKTSATWSSLTTRDGHTSATSIPEWVSSLDLVDHWNTLQSNKSTQETTIADSYRERKIIDYKSSSMKPLNKKVQISDKTTGKTDMIGLKENEVAASSDLELSEDAKKVAAAALAAVKDATAIGKGGRIEISEIRNFAGQDVKLRKLVDPNSKEAEIAKQKEKLHSTSHLDALIAQISKKQKLNILDKSKQDWGEFKEAKGFDEELDAYRKSGNQYLDKVSFLQRAEYREFERERDIRLAQQAKRRLESQKD